MKPGCLLLLAIFFCCSFSLRAQSPEILQALENLKQKVQVGAYAEVLQASSNIRQMAEKEFGIDSPNYGLIIVLVAQAQTEMNLYEQALDNYEAGLKLIQKAPPEYKSFIGVIYSGMGRLYHQNSEYSKAEVQLLKAESELLRTVGPDDLNYTNAINDLGNLYKDKGDFQKSEDFLSKAADIRLRIVGKEHYLYGVSLNNLASLYEQMGNYNRAAENYEKAIAIWRNSLGDNHPLLGNALNNYAGLCGKFGQYENAEKWYLQALDICKATYGVQHDKYAITLGNLGNINFLKGDLVKAEEYTRAAMALRKELLGERHLEYAYSLNNLGIIKIHQHKNEEAEKLLLQALSLFKNLLGSNHKNVASCAKNLGIVYVQKRDVAKASQYFDASLVVQLNRIDYLFPSLSEQERLLFYRTVLDDFDFYNFFSIQNYQARPSLVESVFNYNLSTKALLLNSTNKIRNRIINSGNKELIDLYEQWKLKRDLLAKAWQMTMDEKTKNGIQEEQLEIEVNGIEKKLAKLSETFATQSDRIRYTWKDVQKKLKPGEAGVQIIRFHKYHDNQFLDSVEYVALIVKPQSRVPELVKIGEGHQLEGRGLRFYRNAVKSQLEDTISYTLFWSPLKTHLKDTKKVFFTPDGVYNQINLNTLRSPATKQFLIDELELQQVSNLKDIIPPKKESRLKNAKIIAFPNYQEVPASEKESEKRVPHQLLQRDFNGMQITDLPATRVEMMSVSDILKKSGIEVQSLTGVDANESALKKLEASTILHIATHGFFLKDEELAGQQKAGLIGMQIDKIVDNPLLRSGLLLAGAQRSISGNFSASGEDGILTAYEMMNLDLEQTQLVVLSACETGLGEVQAGEGVYGFQRALISAGAKAVMMSLWKVDDAVTRELMEAFYKLWMSGLPLRNAFHEAQLQVRAKHTDSYFWGAFVLIGG